MKTNQQYRDEAMQEIEVARVAYTAAAIADNAAEAAFQVAKAKDAETRAVKASMLIAYEQMIEHVKDAENKPLTLMRNACVQMSVNVPKVNVKKKTGEAYGVIKVSEAAKLIDLTKLQEKAEAEGFTLGNDSNWKLYASKLGALVAAYVQRNISDKKDPLNRWLQEKAADAMDLGSVPKTASQFDKAVKIVVAAMIGDPKEVEHARNYNSHDREYMLNAATRRSRKFQSIEVFSGEKFVSILMEMCNSMLTGARYDVV